MRLAHSHCFEYHGCYILLAHSACTLLYTNLEHVAAKSRSASYYISFLYVIAKTCIFGNRRNAYM